MYALTIPAEQRVMALVSAFVWAVAQDAQLCQQQAYRLRLAVDETVQNIIHHGHADRSPGAIQIWTEINPKGVSVTIEDTGKVFDMSVHPAPPDIHLPPEQRSIGGLGVYLITHMVDDLRYETVNGHNINRLTILRQSGLTDEE